MVHSHSGGFQVPCLRNRQEIIISYNCSEAFSPNSLWKDSFPSCMMYLTTKLHDVESFSDFSFNPNIDILIILQGNTVRMPEDEVVMLAVLIKKK